MKFILMMLFSLTANAQLLDNVNLSKGYNLYGVDIASDVGYNTKTLTLTGTGLSVKKVGLTKFKVFVLQYFSEHPEKFVRNEQGALQSVNDIGYTAIRMTFVRGVDSTMVRDTINEYLGYNITPEEMPVYEKDIEVMLSAITSDDSFTYGSSITIVAYRNHLLYENTKGKVIALNSVNNNLTMKLFSIFIGNTFNNESYQFKLQLLDDPANTFGVKKQ